MKITDRFDAIDKIGRELQRRFGYDEIEAYLLQFGVNPPAPESVTVNSKRVYSKAALKSAPLSIIARIAEDLGIGSLAELAAQSNPPTLWKGTTKLRLFVSHISTAKLKATRLRDCLKPYSIQAFVAHDDIEPTREWQLEIERALFAMDAFVAILTPGFAKSIWTQQEIGFALGRGVKVVSLRIGEDPTGFISRHQALSRGSKPAEEVAKELVQIFADDERTANRLNEAQAVRLADAPTNIDHHPPKPRRASADWPVRDMFLKLDPNVLDDNRWDELGNSVIDLLACGEIHSWGRRTGRMIFEGGPLVPIPQQFWENAGLDYSFLGPDHTKATHAYAKLKKGNIREEYADLHFCRSEVEEHFEMVDTQHSTGS